MILELGNIFNTCDSVVTPELKRTMLAWCVRKTHKAGNSMGEIFSVVCFLTYNMDKW